MSEFLSDQEQEERIKKWLKTHGYNVFIAVLLGLSAYFGYQYWQNSKANENAMASNSFQMLAQQKQSLNLLQSANKPIPKKDNTNFLVSVDTLVKKYPDTVYAQQALMLKAQYFVDKNELKKAATALSNAKESFKGDKGLHSLINLRLAKVLIADQQTQQAIELLSTIKDEAFFTSKLELMGDAYKAMKKFDEAKKSYREAWATSLKEGDDNKILGLKMATLGMNSLEETSQQKDEMVNPKHEAKKEQKDANA